MSEQKIFVAMRSIDRRTFISPTSTAPDFFELNDIQADRLSLESRVAGLMRTHESVIVNSDHMLRTPSDVHDVQGYAVYMRSVVDYEKARDHGHFDVHDVREMRKGLLELASDVDVASEQERRIHRIKAELFKQVINLFEGKSPDGPRRRS